MDRLTRHAVRRGAGMKARLATLALAVSAVACGHDRNANAQDRYAKIVADAVPTIEKATGLKFKHPPRLETRTKAQVHAFLEKQFDEERSREDIAGQQVLFRRLGLIADTVNLHDFLLALYTEQVAGFYDPETKVLYVVEGAPRDQVGLIIQHELVHALQDQYVNLDSLEHIRGDDDRVLAAQAVMEGQATLVPIQALLGPTTELPAGWDKVREMIRENQSKMPEFANAPEILQETMLFPYLSGAQFVREFQKEKPGEVPYPSNLPTSSEQVMHPQAYFGTPRDEPTTITLPTLTGASATYENDMGEFPIRVMLYQLVRDQALAIRAAQGWDGDRYAILRTPKGDGLAWVSVWDSPVDAAEFGDAMQQYIDRRYGPSTAHDSPAGKRYDVRGRSLLLWGGEIGGRPAVLYVDVPQGVPTNVLDVRHVKLD